MVPQKEDEMIPKITLETPRETRERCAAGGMIWLCDEVKYQAQDDRVGRLMVLGIIDTAGYTNYIPRQSKADTFLVRAARRGHNPTHYFVRKFVSPLKDTPLSFHVSREAGYDESGDQYECLARVRIITQIDPATGVVSPHAVARPPEGQTEHRDETARKRAQSIADETNCLLDHADIIDVSKWIRAIVVGLGGVQSFGRGNNYILPQIRCEAFYNFMEKMRAHCGVNWTRKAQTEGGHSNPCDKQFAAVAAQVTLTDQIAEVRNLLRDDADKFGGEKKRQKVTQKHLERLQEIAARFALYDGIVEAKVLTPLREAKMLYQQKFEALLGGEKPYMGDVESTDGAKSEPTPAVVESSPTTERSPVIVTSSTGLSSDGEALTAAPTDNDTSWLC